MVVGLQEENVVGRANKKKKLVIVGIEKKGKGISRMYAKVISDASEKSFKPFFLQNMLILRPILEQTAGQLIKLLGEIPQT